MRECWLELDTAPPRAELTSVPTELALDSVGNGALHALEEDKAAEKDDEDGGA